MLIFRSTYALVHWLDQPPYLYSLIYRTVPFKSNM